MENELEVTGWKKVRFSDVPIGTTYRLHLEGAEYIKDTATQGRRSGCSYSVNLTRLVWVACTKCEDCPKTEEEKPKPIVTVKFGPCKYKEGEVSYRNGTGFQSIEDLEAERQVIMEKLRNYKKFAKQHGWRQLGEEK